MAVSEVGDLTRDFHLRIAEIGTWGKCFKSISFFKAKL